MQIRISWEDFVQYARNGIQEDLGLTTEPKIRVLRYETHGVESELYDTPDTIEITIKQNDTKVS
jgi:hypothetical protein